MTPKDDNSIITRSLLRITRIPSYQRYLCMVSALSLLLGLALFLRIYRLDLGIPALYSDEVSGQYNAWMNFQIADKSWVEFLFENLFLRVTSFTWILGLTPLGARLPAAIYGSVLVIFLWWFARQIKFGEKFKNGAIALVVLALGAVLPWAVHISRIGHTSVPLLLIFVCAHLGAYLRAKRIRDYLFSFVLLLIAGYFYPSMVLIIPVATVVILREMHRQGLLEKIKWFVVFLGILAIAFAGVYFQRASVRSSQLALWNDVNVTADSDDYRGLAKLSEPTIFSFGLNPEEASRLVYNYPTAVFSVFARTYLSFFSPDFLFLKGDRVLRHSTGQVGSFYLFLLPFMLYGTFLLFKSDNTKVKELFLAWILVSPIPAALTSDGTTYLLRAITMMPFLTYLSVLGLVTIIEKLNERETGDSQKLTQARNCVIEKLRCGEIKKLMTVGIICVVGIYSVYYFLFSYFQVYPLRAAKSYEFGFKELSDFQVKQENKPMLIVWDGYYPQWYFRFWQKTPADEFLAFKPSEENIEGSVFQQRHNNLYFVWPKTETDVEKFIKERKIDYVIYPEEFARKNPRYRIFSATAKEIVLYPDKTPAFYVYAY